MKNAIIAIKNNIKPGILLWIILLFFGVAYVSLPTFEQWLQSVAELKARSGFIFAFLAFAIPGALLPEILKIFFFQNGMATKDNLANVFYIGLIYGLNGMCGDVFYSIVQVELFGAGSDIFTILKKTFVDQFVYSPIICTAILLLLMWKANGFRANTKNVSFPQFFTDKLFPLYVAQWLVWIPSVCLVYFMPTALQLPVASFVLCFWSLIVSFMSTKNG